MTKKRTEVAPAITIVTLLYRRHEFIHRAIMSVLKQTRRDWELLLVQDGDDEAVSAAAEELQSLDPRIHYHQRGRVGTIGEATNWAIRTGRGEFIGILDDDDEWATPDKLAIQIALLESRPDIVAVGGGVIVVNRDGIELMRYQKPVDDESIRKIALVANPIAHSAAIFRRSAFERVEGYEAFEIADFQDWDFWLKLGSIGKLANVPEFVLRYTVWDNSSSALRHRSNAKSALRIIKRHKGKYTGFVRAYAIGLVYYAYSFSPSVFRDRMMMWFSLAKKRIFSR